MFGPEIVVTVGLFVISLLVAVYLIRYSNQQVTSCLSTLEKQHNELVDLNGKLAKELLSADKKLRAELDATRSHLVSHKKKVKNSA